MGDCLIVCKQCGAPQPERGISATVMPFHDAERAIDWAERHITATGHRTMYVPGWPDPDEAWAQTWEGDH